MSADALDEIHFLSGASARGRSSIAGRIELREFAEGETIFREGDPPEHLFVIREGAIEIVASLPDGGEEVQRTLGPGRILGELGILGGHARTASARAAEPSELWAVEREGFLELYESEPTVSVEIASSMATYLLDADGVAEDLLFLNLEGRVAKRLLNFLEAAGTGVHRITGTDQMTPEQVADKLREMARDLAEPEEIYTHLERLALLSGGSRRAVARVLIEMQRRGLLIGTEGNLIVIDDDGLRALSSPR